MSAGIYKLTFRDGSYYIGKSNDLARRWDQHAKNMAAGKHAKKLQLAYDRYGDPLYNVLINCHEDHLDTLEGILINSNWSPHILNTTRPRMISEKEWEDLQRIPRDYWLTGPIGNMTDIINLNNYISELEDDVKEATEAFEESLADMKEEVKHTKRECLTAIAALKSGTLVEVLEREKSQLKKERDALKSRGFFARLFNN